MRDEYLAVWHSRYASGMKHTFNKARTIPRAFRDLGFHSRVNPGICCQFNRVAGRSYGRSLGNSRN